MVQSKIKRVAVIGAGPAGAITIDALAREDLFDVIRVFERREGAGGCWIGDSNRPPVETNLSLLADRTADPPLSPPSSLPGYTPKSNQERYTDSPVYPDLESNIDHSPMQFSQEPIPAEQTQRSIKLYGEDTPFRHWKVMRRYIRSLVERRGYEDFISYNTTVEKVEKSADLWKVVLRKSGKTQDYWWVEHFDAVVVATGHYSVPYIPDITGLEQLERLRPGSVVHSKHYRGKDLFKNKRVVVVGASVSAADIAVDLVGLTKTPVHAITIGHAHNGYFGDEAFNHPRIKRHPSISHVTGRNVHLVDGTSIQDVDHIIFGTGYSWTMPFLAQVELRNNRVAGLYQHVVWQHDPTLLFVGAVHAGLTFKIFEWQAVYAARLLSGRGTLPSTEEMKKWEEARIKARGDGPKFALVFPDFEDYFETLRRLAGPAKGVGRELPQFKREWFRAFLEGHERRKNLWRRLNAKAMAENETLKANSIKPRL